MARRIARRPVVCLETGELWPSARAAATELFVDHSSFHKAVCQGATSVGYHWAFADDPELSAKMRAYSGRRPSEARGRPRPVLDMVEEVRYPSVTCASRLTGVPISTVRRDAAREGERRWVYEAELDAEELERMEWRDDFGER